MEDDDMMLGGWYSSFGEDPLMSSPGFPDELRASEEVTVLTELWRTIRSPSSPCAHLLGAK